MNKLVLGASVCIGLFFAACGDDSNSVKPSLDESSSSSVILSGYSHEGSSESKPSSSSVKSSSSAKSSSSTKTSSFTGRMGEMTDSRDGQTYKTVTIGRQTWMAENLNFETEYSSCYNDSTKYCEKYGRLYSWYDAVDSACPTGWHLPKTTEFETLFTAVGDSSIAGVKLKSTSGWFNDGGGTDDYAFSALPAGYRVGDGTYQYEEVYAHFWSLSMISMWNSNSVAPAMVLYYRKDEARLSTVLKYFRLSVRCVED